MMFFVITKKNKPNERINKTFSLPKSKVCIINIPQMQHKYAVMGSCKLDRSII